MTRKNADYWEGYNAEADRNAGAGNVTSLAHRVARAMGRDNARKQRIFARSPNVFSGMDAEELGRASSVELAMRELGALGIDPKENDPLAILDAHHAGRQWARDNQRPGGARIGGSASDSAGDSFLDRYLNET